jgi:hypothetical protein
VTNDFDALMAEQHGVCTVSQARSRGVTDSSIGAQLAAHRWQRTSDGVIVAHNGPLDDEAQQWSALLACGEGALLSHGTAAYLQGLVSEPPGRIHVTVPGGRKVIARPGLVVHRTRHPMHIAVGRQPPQLAVEDTLLDRADRTRSAEQVVTLVVVALSKRTTTPERIAGVLAGRHRSRWRSLIGDLVDDGDGVESVLEWRYRRDVERRHGLPTASRQHVVGRAGQRDRRDAVYGEYCTVIELDGRLGHTGIGRFKDMRRDNAAATRGEVVLRYGWADVAG